MHDAHAGPKHHVGAGLFLDVAAQMLVGRPKDLLPLLVQMAHDVEAHARSDAPVGARLHGRAGVGIDDHGAVRMRIAELGEFIGWAAEVERAFSLERGHEHALVRAQNLGGLAHEAHARHDERLGRMVAPEARHFERVGNTAAGLEREVLQIGIDVVMRNQHRAQLAQQLRRTGFQRGALFGRQGLGHAGPGAVDDAVADVGNGVGRSGRKGR